MKTSLRRIANILSSACALLVISASLSYGVAPVQNQNADDVMELIGAGSSYYIKHDFKAAIGPYQKALDMEKQKRTLNKTLWKVLIDNLGMAYGITGDLENAKETFEYGISKDPEYPLFYYNMACTYGELKNMDKAIDSSFKRFLKNEDFQAALRELRQK